MLQIIDEAPKKRKFADQLLGGIQQAGQQLPQVLGDIAETKAISKQFGPEIAALSPELRREYLKAQFTGKMQKRVEKEHALNVGLETIDKMRSLIPSAGPSNYLSSLLGGETRKNRAELETLGRSLIPLVAAGVPIRNQKEFEEYRKTITNPNSRQDDLEGALNGLQGLFERSMMEDESGSHQEKTTKKAAKTKFNPQHPEHKAKATQLYKTYKDKAKVRKELEREFEF